MQVMRLVPMRDWHSHWARAVPVSVPSQTDAAGEVVSQEATQGGVEVWVRARGRRKRMGRSVDFMVLVGVIRVRGGNEWTFLCFRKN
jgi:hypothetical protein